MSSEPFSGEFNAALVAPFNSAERRNLAAGMERQPGRSAAVAQFGRVGCLGASQSSGLRRQASWLKVWRGGGCHFSATERAHKRNGGQVDAECRRPCAPINVAP